MNFVEVKTSELISSALDYAVAVCEDNVPLNIYGNLIPEFIHKYSTDWEAGGPIIEQEGGALWSTNADGWRYKACYDFANDKEGVVIHGPTPLIAAMRGYVASKLGDVVKIPQELLE